MMPPKPLVATNIVTGEVIEFPSIKQAQKAGFTPKYIKMCCRGDQVSHKGYTWQTLEDFEWERAPRCHEYGECCFRNHGKCTALSDTNFGYGFCTFRKSSPDGENLYDKGAFEYDRN